MQKTVSEMVSEAKSKIDNLNPDQVQQAVASGNAVLIDIRDRSDSTRRRAVHRGCGAAG